MLALTSGFRYYIYRGVTDFRCGMDSLCGLVRQQSLPEPTGGDIYIFFNRRRTQVKLLHFEGDGFGLYHKRLEAGTYELPEAASNATRKKEEDQLSEQAFLALRQEQAVPVLQELKAWLLENYQQVMPKSPIGQAIAYALPRWEKLSAYLADGRLRIDNNLVENAIRPLALGRKNYLFAGSHEGANRAAMIYSFMGSCKIHQINPQAWLTDVLERIALHPVNKLEELLPGNWKPSPVLYGMETCIPDHADPVA